VYAMVFPGKAPTENAEPPTSRVAMGLNHRRGHTFFQHHAIPLPASYRPNSKRPVQNPNACQPASLTIMATSFPFRSFLEPGFFLDGEFTDREACYRAPLGAARATTGYPLRGRRVLYRSRRHSGIISTRDCPHIGGGGVHRDGGGNVITSGAVSVSRSSRSVSAPSSHRYVWSSRGAFHWTSIRIRCSILAESAKDDFL
jgi:hypothetical protein